MDIDASLAGLPFQSGPPERKFTLDEAVGIVHQVQLRLTTVEDVRLKLNWCLGLVVAHTERPRGRRVKIIEEIAARVRREHGMRVNVVLLYYCVRLYRRFDGNVGKFETWISGSKILLERPVFWSDVIELLGGRNNPHIIGREEADRRDLLDAERAADTIERVVARAVNGDEEAEGFLEGMRQTVEGMHAPGSQAVGPVRDERYLVFVRRYGCLVCNRQAEAHHAFGFRGRGSKPSDYTCVPLCREHHDELHRRGPRTVQARYDLDFVETAFNLFHRYATGRWLTMHLEKVR